MGSAIGEILAPAIGVALSPLPIVGVILMLLSPNAVKIAPAFVVGWVAAIVIVVGVVMLLVNTDDLSNSDGDPSTTSIIIHLIFGVLLLLLGVQQWRKRPKAGTTPEMPKWMASIDKVSIPVAIGLGALLGGINPKNLIFNLAAASAIVQSGASTGGEIVALVVFVVIASLSVAVPVIWYLADRERAKGALDELKGWLVQNNAVVMCVLFLVLGVSQLGKGISGM
jgi:threonine/homoserine/homoserine lactone efflux protein